MEKILKKEKGITLVALVVTIIVLLILAGISLGGVFGDRGIFKRAEDAGERHNEARAREALETVLLAEGQYEKNTNPEYNQDDYLDELIIAEIKGADVQGDIAIVDGYAYELDRSVPKIGKYLGRASDLVIPEVKLSTPVIAEDSKTATFTITAKEEKNGIERIEIWLEGQKVGTIPCNNEKTPAPIPYEVNRNGTYTVKAISTLTGSARTKVEGLVASVSFTPDGSTTYKKEHSTKITIKETADSITEVKYKWTESVTAPGAGEFSDSTTNNSTITGSGMTGKRYLWVMLKTASGKTNICGSKEFYFDNEAPTASLDAEPISETSFKLTATASDELSGVASYEFYIDGDKKEPTTIEDGKATYTWNGTGMAVKNCYVIVTDKAGNQQRADKEARTKLYAWQKWDTVLTKHYKAVVGPQDPGTYYFECGNSAVFYNSYTINHTDGTFSLGGNKISNPTETNPGYSISSDGKTLTQYSGQPYSSSAKIKRDFEMTAKHNYKIKGSNEVMLAVCYDDFTAYTRKITLEEDSSVPSKGNTLQGIVRSINPNEYPNGGEKDGSWYVAVEIQ